MCTEDHLHFDYIRLAWDSGFCFDDYKNKSAFDISVIGLVDIDNITKHRDIATVVKHIPAILQFRLSDDLAKILEPTFVKVFRLCQLAIQYLRFCKTYLDNTVVLLKRELADTTEENIDLQRCVETLKQENAKLQKENLDLEKSLTAATTVTFKCDECPKVFYSDEYLKAHIKRRHGNQEMQSESEKLQLEIKELKQRLNNTEKYIQFEKVAEKELSTVPNNDSVFQNPKAEEQLEEKFEQLKDHIDKELGTLRDETFYKNIYDKWFNEIFQKVQVPQKTYVEKGAGDCIECKESATQTNVSVSTTSIGTCTSPLPKPRVIEKSVKAEDIQELEDKFKQNVNEHRVQLENVLEEKISGSIGRLETQMDSFWKKLSYLELKKIEEQTEALKNNILQKHSPTVTSQLSQTRYLTTSNNKKCKIVLSESSTENASSKEEKEEESRVKKKTDVAIHNPKVLPRTRRRSVDLDEKPKKEKNVAGSSKMFPDRIYRFDSLKRKQRIPIIVQQKKISSEENSVDEVEVVKSKKISTSIQRFDESSEEESMKKLKKPSGIVIVGQRRSPEETEESENEIKHCVTSKPSFTSTLADRSLTSLKNAAQDPEVLENFKSEIQQMIDKKLEDLGVDPQWTEIPENTYKYLMKILQHEASLVKKGYPRYNRIREEILKKLDERIQNENGKGKHKRIKSCSRSGKRTKELEVADFRKPKRQESVEVQPFAGISDLSSDLSLQNNVVAVQKLESPKQSLLKPDQAQLNKKRVLFNLDNADLNQQENSVKQIDVGDSTSLTSSLLDGSKTNVINLTENKENLGRKKEEEYSDWDISDL